MIAQIPVVEWYYGLKLLSPPRDPVLDDWFSNFWHLGKMWSLQEGRGPTLQKQVMKEQAFEGETRSDDWFSAMWTASTIRFHHQELNYSTVPFHHDGLRPSETAEPK